MITCDVFISYARRDFLDDNGQVIPGNIISKIMEMLSSAGISYWIDEERLEGGDNFPIKIAQQIKTSKVFLLISSARSNQSDWIINEVATARNYNVPIIPFRYDDTPFNTGLMIYVAGLQYISYPQNSKAALQKLLQSIQTILTGGSLSLGNNKENSFWKKHRVAVLSAIGGLVLGGAIAFGIYRFINRPIQEAVYITPHGDCYHIDPNCRGIKGRNVQTVSYEEALKLDRRPCSICIKQN